jgi:hypothetical protein
LAAKKTAGKGQPSAAGSASEAGAGFSGAFKIFPKLLQSLVFTPIHETGPKF